jgi:hypothetical protein
MIGAFCKFQAPAVAQNSVMQNNPLTMTFPQCLIIQNEYRKAVQAANIINSY